MYIGQDNSNVVYRPRRNRKSEVIRSLCQEIFLQKSQLIYPLFILIGSNKKEEITSMPGIYRLSLDYIIEENYRMYFFGYLFFYFISRYS